MEGINFDQFSFVHAESDFLQLSEPSYMETTTTEEDPETQERYFLLGGEKKKNIKSIKHTFCNIYKYYFLQSNENCSSNYNNEWNRQWSRRIARVYAKDRR